MEYSPELKSFIHEHNSLFWYTPEDQKENISPELLVETILNYGDMDAVRKLFRIMGSQSVAAVFFNATGRKQLNYYPEIHAYFSLVLKKYA
ncbi:MAG: hypothetical protein WC865_17610 [Bacteroidales bacterium]